jgi:transcriptional regulator with XRE-family HTH domain
VKSLHTARYQKLLDYLVAARKSRGLSQQAVADRLQRPQSFVSKYESGERRIDVVELLTLAEVVGFDVIEVIDTLSVTQRRGKRADRKAS